METRKRSKLVLRLLQFGFLLAVAGGLVLFFPAQPHVPPPAIAVEIARIPSTLLDHYINAVILKNGEIILTGLEHRISPKAKVVEDVVVFRLTNGGAKKLFTAYTALDSAILMEPIIAGVSPDEKNVLFGSTYVLGSTRPRILYLRMDDKKLLWSKQYATHIEQAWRPFSDDGALFVACKSSSGTNLWLYDSATGKPLRQIASIIPGNEFRGFGFLPGSHNIQFIELPSAARSDWRLWQVDVKTGKQRLVRQFTRSYSIYPSPCGDLFAQVSAFGGRLLKVGNIELPLGRRRHSAQVAVVDAYGTTKKKVYQCDGNECIADLKWSHDNRFIAALVFSQGDKYRIDVVDVASGVTIRRHRAQTKRMYLYDWYPDSKSVLCGYDTETHTVLQKLSINNSR